jgi:hypothetical protein
MQSHAHLSDAKTPSQPVGTIPTLEEMQAVGPRSDETMRGLPMRYFKGGFNGGAVRVESQTVSDDKGADRDRPYHAMVREAASNAPLTEDALRRVSVASSGTFPGRRIDPDPPPVSAFTDSTSKAAHTERRYDRFGGVIDPDL